VQPALDSLKAWSGIWQLRLSVLKYSSLFLAGRSNYVDVHQLHIANNAINTFNVVKNLGVMIDCRLTFSPQIDMVVSKAKQRVSKAKLAFTYF